MDQQKHLRALRARIDDIDRLIIELLARRYDVIRDVGQLKSKHGIASVLPDRIDEVCRNAAAEAAIKGLDAEFIRNLFAQIIEHSCRMEDRIIGKVARNPGQEERNRGESEPDPVT